MSSNVLTTPPQYAGFWRRVAAAFVDGIVLILVLSSILWLLERAGLSRDGSSAVAGLLVVFGYLLYNASFESSPWQATLGKKVLRIAVTDNLGNRVSFKKAFSRNFCKAFSLLILYIGFLMVGFTKTKQGLHDQMTGCVVIRTPQPRDA